MNMARIRGVLCRPCTRAGRWASRGQGLTLLEIVVAVTFAGITTSAVVGLLGIGIISGQTVTDRTTGTMIARSQAESILSQTYLEDGTYSLIPDLPGDVNVVVDAVPLVPQSLQRVTVTVTRDTAGRGESQLATVSTLKSNRFTTTGSRPSIGGLEVVHSLSLPTLAPRSGFYATYSVVPSATRGLLVARWQLQATPPVGTALEARQMSINVYPGTPLGTDSGLASVAPDAVAAAPVASGTNLDVVLEVTAKAVTSQTYTVYLFNEDEADTATTARATVACICPQP